MQFEYSTYRIGATKAIVCVDGLEISRRYIVVLHTTGVIRCQNTFNCDLLVANNYIIHGNSLAELAPGWSPATRELKG